MNEEIRILDGRNMIIVILILILGCTMFIAMNRAKATLEANGLVESLNAEVITWKDKDSLNHSKIQTIETQSTKDFLAIQSTDSAIIALQETVEEYKKYLKNSGSVTNITNVTEVHNHSETITTYDKDSLPVYSSYFNLDNWVLGSVEASSDTTVVDLTYISSYTIVIGEEKVDMFNKHRFVDVKNHNPYASAATVRTYEKSLARVKRFGFGPYVGIGVGATLVPQVNIGLGVQFNLIQF